LEVIQSEAARVGCTCIIVNALEAVLEGKFNGWLLSNQWITNDPACLRALACMVCACLQIGI
jgi:hypothetical protein